MSTESNEGKKFFVERERHIRRKKEKIYEPMRFSKDEEYAKKEGLQDNERKRQAYRRFYENDYDCDR